MFPVTLYHNPQCGTSRNVLALIRAAGIEPQIVEYLKTPPDRATLHDLLARLCLTPRGLLRPKGEVYESLGLADPALPDALLVDAMLAHPVLINRPLVLTPRGALLCRPVDRVHELLPAPTAPPATGPLPTP